MVGNTKAGSAKKPLEQTLARTQGVAADVQSASDNLAVVNTVLEKELPDDLQVGDVAQAIEQTGQLEKKLAESAKQLAEANAALAEEIRKSNSTSST